MKAPLGDSSFKPHFSVLAFVVKPDALRLCRRLWNCADSLQQLLPQQGSIQGHENRPRPRDVQKLMLLELTALLRVDHDNVVGVKTATLGPHPAIVFEDCGNQCTLWHWISVNVAPGGALLQVPCCHEPETSSNFLRYPVESLRGRRWQSQRDGP